MHNIETSRVHYAAMPGTGGIRASNGLRETIHVSRSFTGATSSIVGGITRMMLSCLVLPV